MEEIHRLTINIPTKLLKDAMKYSKTNKTNTLVMGLEELIRRQAYQEIRSYRGKLPLRINLKKKRMSRI